MPLTRSQATRNTRSTSRATLSLGIQETRGKNVASESKSRKALTQAQPEDRLTIKMLEVLTEIFWWIIGKYCSKVFKIILRQLKDTYPVVFSFAMIVTLMIYVFFFMVQMILMASQVWCTMFPAELHGIYILKPQDNDMYLEREAVSNVIKEMQRLTKKHNGKEIHAYLVSPCSSAPTSECARRVGLRLIESMKQNKRPVDVITIEAANVTSLWFSLRDAVLAVDRRKRLHGEKAEDTIRQLNEELELDVKFLSSSEALQMRFVEILFKRFKELLENSLPVLIFDNVQDLELLSNLKLKPGNDHTGTFVVIIALQESVTHESLEKLQRDYVHIQPLRRYGFIRVIYFPLAGVRCKTSGSSVNWSIKALSTH